MAFQSAASFIGVAYLIFGCPGHKWVTKCGQKKDKPSKRTSGWDKLKCFVVADFKAKKRPAENWPECLLQASYSIFRQINV